MTLRPATLADSKFCWKLRNAPDVRKVSNSAEYILWNVHQYWWMKNREHIRIIEHNGKRVGYLRVQDGLISIAIAKKYRRKGLALKALKSVHGKAEIKTENLPSIWLFEKAGFVLTRLVYEKK